MKRISVLATALSIFVASSASAFCGFYVSGADATLYSNATMVVMMREGQRTVLSMQNNYQGPPEDFAMVVPVPVVLSEENVKTLPRAIFERIDQLSAPRLVEYWEADPCAPVYRFERMRRGSAQRSAGAVPSSAPPDLGVRVEAQFAVGEYDIVILSASDSAGLETWLHRENYNIPEGASETLRPYVEAGTKFFVAKVDVERVEFRDGQALLSPLRVHYDSDEFSLPVRLGLLNSNGEQDLIVHILAPGLRYEVANYDNTVIPTNIRVTNEVRDEFGGFYEYLFRETVARHPRAVVTEYAWDASGCDPCPTPALNPQELLTLGGDIMPSHGGSNYVLTRLHYRYTKHDLNEDLVFRPAVPLVGGGGIPSPEGEMVATTTSGGINRFQGRYVILHPWEGAIACESPNRGQWGGPPGSTAPRPRAASNRALRAGVGGAVPDASSWFAQDVPELALPIVDSPEDEASGDPPHAEQSGDESAPGEPSESSDNSNGETTEDESRTSSPPAVESRGGCAGCATSGQAGSREALALLAFVALVIAARRAKLGS